MSDAYKCDRCGEFHEGIPETVEISHGYELTGTNTTGRRKYKEFEVCERCHKKIRNFIGDCYEC